MQGPFVIPPLASFSFSSCAYPLSPSVFFFWKIIFLRANYRAYVSSPRPVIISYSLAEHAGKDNKLMNAIPFSFLHSFILFFTPRISFCSLRRIKSLITRSKPLDDPYPRGNYTRYHFLGRGHRANAPQETGRKLIPPCPTSL